MLFFILFLILSAAGSVLLTMRISSGWCMLPVGLALMLGLFVGLVVLFLVVLFISGQLVDRSKPQEKQNGYLYFLTTQFLFFGFLFGGVRIHASGVELVPRKQPFLLVCNHIYDFDPAVLIHVLPRARMGFISKKENENIFFANKVMHAIQCVSVDRENDREALKSIIRTAAILKEGRHSMGVFPEGYESKSGELLPFRNGVFKIAQRAQVPIVVAVLRGTKAIPANMFRRRTDVDVEILGVVPVEDIKNVLTRDIGDRIHAMMEAALERKGAV